MLLGCYKEGVLEAGCDEAGRGCLAGPVYGAAVIPGEGFNIPGLRDSKLLTAKQRYALRDVIISQAVAWAIGIADNTEIDRINILNASILAIHRAIERLSPVPGHLIVDGNRFKPFNGIPFQTIVRGESHYRAIAAASILAKTFRDEYMDQLHEEYRHFGWDRNKGYPTSEHRAALKRFGTTRYHRKTFRHCF